MSTLAEKIIQQEKLLNSKKANQDINSTSVKDVFDSIILPFINNEMVMKGKRIGHLVISENYSRYNTRLNKIEFSDNYTHSEVMSIKSNYKKLYSFESDIIDDITKTLYSKIKLNSYNINSFLNKMNELLNKEGVSIELDKNKCFLTIRVID